MFGDGEMDEPESMSALTLAAREKLDNLVWVVSCNLQRLDGPVRGNGRIIDELEALFAGAGWRVVKVVWGSDWDGLFARDGAGAIAKAFAQTVEGHKRSCATNPPVLARQNCGRQVLGDEPGPVIDLSRPQPDLPDALENFASVTNERHVSGDELGPLAGPVRPEAVAGKRQLEALTGAWLSQRPGWEQLKQFPTGPQQQRSQKLRSCGTLVRSRSRFCWRSRCTGLPPPAPFAVTR